MKVEITDQMETLIRMIEAHRRSLAKAKVQGEPAEVIRSFEFVIRETQAELSDLISEAYRHEVRV